MAQWILKEIGKGLLCCFPVPLLLEDIHSATKQKKSKLFVIFVDGRCGTSVNPPQNSSNNQNETDF